MPDYKIVIQKGIRQTYLVSASNRFKLIEDISEGKLKPNMTENFSDQMNIKEIKPIEPLAEGETVF